MSWRVTIENPKRALFWVILQGIDRVTS